MTEQLPTGWRWTTVGDVCNVEYGKGLAKKERVATGAVDVYGSAGLAGHHDSALVEDPAVIVGRKGNAGMVWLTAGPSWPIDTTYFLRPPTGVLPAFLSFQLRNLDLVQKDSSTTIPSLRRPDLEMTGIAVAPTAEQERIVTAIEEHLSRLDAAEQAVASAGDKGSALPSIAIQSLFSNRWPTRKVGDVARVGSGATPKRSEQRYWSGGTVPWVKSGAVNARSITAASELITEQALAETSVKLWPAGTVLVAMYGEGKTRGKAARLDIEATCNQACAAIDYDQSVVHGDYLLAYLNAQYEASRRLASGGVQPNLSLGLIKNMEVPLPDLDEQRAVAQRSGRIMQTSDRLSQVCGEVHERGAGLRRSILAAAFSGQLVDQDPTDEPATVLLERIAVERPAPKKTRKTTSA